MAEQENKNNIDEDDQKLFLGMIEMRQDKIRQEIDKLDVSEKILLVGDIWDSIVQDCSTMPPLQEWQKKELDKRLADYETGKLTTRDWKDVHNDIREQYK
jgi:putative addiction module component (TIGR02574 family)